MGFLALTFDIIARPSLAFALAARIPGARIFVVRTHIFSTSMRKRGV